MNAAPFKNLSPRILLVDDAAEDRLLLADFLRQQGYRLYVAEDGLDGYQKAVAIQPDLVLLDIHMPRCDGLATCRRLKADGQTSKIPVIFLTAAAMPQDRVAGLNEGAVDYVTKPFDFEEVKLRVGIHLGLANKVQTTARTSSAAPEDDAAPGHASNLDKVLFASARKILRESLAAAPNLSELAAAVGIEALERERQGGLDVGQGLDDSGLPFVGDGPALGPGGMEVGGVQSGEEGPLAGTTAVGHRIDF